MLKKLSENKSQIIAVVLIAAVVLVRNLTALYSKGNPLLPILTFCILMSVLYVLFFFNKIPSKKEDFFTGESLIRIVTALIVFLWSFSTYYINHDFCLAMIALPVMIFCAADIRFMPINVVVALALTMFRYEAVAFSVILWSVVTSFVLVAPGLKEAETWKKLVFSAAQICTSAAVIYNAYQLRFNFSFQGAKGNIITTVVIALLAVLFIACMAISLRSKKATPARKKKKAVEGKKAEYYAAFGYAVAAAAALLCAMLDRRTAMVGIAGSLMSLLMLCRNSTCIQIYADKAAGAIEGVVDKIAASDNEE